MSSIVSNLNVGLTEPLEKGSKKMSRKERRDRKKRKKYGDGETSPRGADSAATQVTSASASTEKKDDNSLNGEQEEQKTSLLQVKPRSVLTNSSGGRTFSSNTSLYKNRPLPPSLLNNTNINVNNSTDNNNNCNSLDEKREHHELENLKVELSKAIHDKNMSQLNLLIGKFKEYKEGMINSRFDDGLTLLHKAVQSGSPFIIKILLENGAIINVPSITGLSPLHYAAQLADIHSVEFLLSNNANAMQRDIENRNCLHLAVEGGNLQCVELIAKQPGILINHRDNAGCSALHLAVKLQNIDIVDFLLSKRADPLLLDQSGNRPIDLLPGYSKFINPKNLKLTAQSKKVYKLLKKKGGHRLPSVSSKSEVIGGGIIRSRSLDHRNPVISAEFARNLQSKGININLSTSNFSSPPIPEKKQEVVKEKDLELLYYTPTPRSKDDSTPRPTTSPNLKKTDKYGFYTSNSEANLAVKQSKIIKEEKMALKWLEVIKNWEDVKPKKIQKYCDRGIPDSVRGTVWKLLAGCDDEAATSEVVYEELLQRDSIPKVKEQILKDINRTMPNHILFQEKGQGQQMLTNVLTAYSVYKPSVGYCQGMGFITAMFLMYMPEEDAFWMLDRIADEYRFARLWDEQMTLVTECMYALGCLMHQNLPEVQAKLEEDNIPPISYVPQFFITGFLYSLPFPMVVRIWDSFLLRKFDYLYAVAIALFKVTKDKIMKMKMEQLMIFLRFKENGEELDFSIEQLIKTALNIWSKLSPNQIRKLEEEGGLRRAEEKRRMLNERESN